MTRPRKQSGQFAIPPGYTMTMRVVEITITPEPRSGIQHATPLADGLARCETYDIDDDDRDEPTQRWLRRTGT